MPAPGVRGCVILRDAGAQGMLEPVGHWHTWDDGTHGMLVARGMLLPMECQSPGVLMSMGCWTSVPMGWWCLWAAGTHGMLEPRTEGCSGDAEV